MHFFTRHKDNLPHQPLRENKSFASIILEKVANVAQTITCYHSRKRGEPMIAFAIFVSRNQAFVTNSKGVESQFVPPIFGGLFEIGLGIGYST